MIDSELGCAGGYKKDSKFEVTALCVQPAKYRQRIMVWQRLQSLPLDTEKSWAVYVHLSGRRNQ